MKTYLAIFLLLYNLTELQNFSIRSSDLCPIFSTPEETSTPLALVLIKAFKTFLCVNPPEII